MNRRRGFTLIEILVVVAIIGVLMSLLLPALARARKSAQLLQDGNAMREMHRSMKMHGQDTGDGLPVPGEIACKGMDFDGDGVEDQYVPFKGPENPQHNSTDHLVALMIAMDYFDTKLPVSAVETSPHVEVDDDHVHGRFNPAIEQFWDESFSSNITGLGPFGNSNVSFAHQHMTGKRKKDRWGRATVDSNVAQMSSRGTEKGNVHPNEVDPEAYESSYTLQMHGQEDMWLGAFVMADNSTRNSEGFYINGCEFQPRGGFAGKLDNQFFNEDDHSNAYNVSETSAGTWTDLDAQGGDSWMTITTVSYSNQSFPIWD